MQQQANIQIQQQLNPLFSQNPVIPDLNLVELCPRFEYPLPPCHYKQIHYQPPNLSIIKQYSEGFSSFGCQGGALKITPWSGYGEKEFKAYDQNIKAQLRNLNNSIFSKMKIVIELIREASKPELLKELNNDIEKHMVEFFHLSKVMKQFHIRRNLYEKCQSETLKYQEMNTKYSQVYQDTLSRLYKFATNPVVFNLLDD